GLKENIRPHEICVDLYLKIYDKLKDEYGRKQRDK
ncbi:TPA: 16S rRNA (adenine(1518)-N(6)/adenine(1519)-N(6))-dimethyltransferase, partial [Campylobacter jejuni]|nr:16S rRNA (adenine(1518)-N(6)/adenine(1519)-N(6))-dimethyltransferase [Campylobacter jejuni]